MAFVMAFLIGGALCLLFQIILDLTKGRVPVILLVGLIAGGVLTPLGITGALSQLGGAGFLVMVVGAGQALCETTQAALAGDPLPLLSVLGVFVALTLVGLVCGSCNLKVRKKRQTVASDTERAAEQG